MTTLCMADYTGAPVRATETLRDSRSLWEVLKERASAEEGAEIAGILQAISEYSPMVHSLIYDIAWRDIKVVVAARREEAHRLARDELERSQRSALQPHFVPGAAFASKNHVLEPQAMQVSHLTMRHRDPNPPEASSMQAAMPSLLR